MGLKIAIALVGLSFVATVAGGAFVYYKTTQEAMAELNKQVATYSQAVEQQKEAIAMLEDSIREQAAIRNELSKEVESARKDVEKMQANLAKYDLKTIASHKAGLLEKKINQATADVLRCFELATGAEAVPNEQNRKCSDLLTNTNRLQSN